MENEKKSHPLNDLMRETMERLRAMVDVDTIVGDPIHTEDVTLLPVSRISMGFASGGSDFISKNQKQDRDNPFGGGSGAGVNIYPVGFLVIRGQSVRFLPVASPADTAAGRLVEMIPDLVDKLSELIHEQQEKKAAEAESET